ncbi:hypothetical protein DL764_010344 [Monosporascus ibericus]|uniref:Uncharacterized protein n=1 Tax=Monosporascus ibericus TaxID=155417 RepID=A0A4Q4SV12_9PEZI|nr:hypothetical protein DL764_010344 [Monosporascus ibericus]
MSSAVSASPLNLQMLPPPSSWAIGATRQQCETRCQLGYWRMLYVCLMTRSPSLRTDGAKGGGLAGSYWAETLFMPSSTCAVPVYDAPAYSRTCGPRPEQ